MLDKPTHKSWHDLFDELPDDLKDIHFLPEYVMAHHLGHHMDYGALTEPDRFQTFDGNRSPYGYGGPHFFSRGFSPYRFHPLYECPIHPDDAVHEKDIAAIDLTKPEWYSRSITNGLRSAELAGVNVTRDEEFAPTLFAQLYKRTMERKGADANWLLGSDYFKRLHKLMRPHFKLFTGYVGDVMEAQAIVLHGWGKAYYHYSASYRRYPEAAIGTAIVHDIAVWAREQGMEWLHLGGGPTREPDDSVLTWKKGFTNGKMLPVYRWQRGE